jgi:hypothetical protein
VNKTRVLVASAIVAAAALGIGTVAAANGNGGHRFDEHLTGFEETPALSTPGNGTFRAFVDNSAQEIHYRLRFGDLESDATQAHIHFENATNSGPIVVFLCSNLGNGPVGTQACPAAGGTISGTIRPADVTDMASANGIAAGEFNELVRAMKAGATYVNVHSVNRAAGEIRAQLDDDHHSHD